MTVNIPGAATDLSGAAGTPQWARTAADAVDDLYRVHAVGLVRLALLLVGDRATAEDVVQDAFLGLYRGWQRIRDPGSGAGYLRVAVVNGCRSALRRRSRARLLRVPHDPPIWSAEAAAMDGEDRRAVLAAVARLPRRQREVLALRYYLGLGDSEIADSLSISRGTVSSTASRALAVLAREIGEEL
ncbi:MAG TPA: SigE family RNA polymerase sigma factor [Streptosporangiaceae bacterium]